MTTVYLVRHAEAEGNLYRRVQGQFDGEVTPQGKQQIEALRRRFTPIALDAVYASDLRRAVETAGALMDNRSFPLVQVPALRECALGAWEDIGWGEVEHTQPELLHAFNFDPAKWCVEGGEDFASLTKRLTDAIVGLAAKHPGGTIGVVSHGMAIRAFLCGALGIPSERVREIPHCDNTAVAKLAIEGEHITVEYFGDNSHLPKNISTFAQQDWWKKTNGLDRKNIRFEPLELPQDAALYTRCYADSWKAAHGSTLGFSANLYLQEAKLHVAEHPLSIRKVYCVEDFAGLLELSVSHGAEQGIGWVTLCYLTEEMRGRNFGVQLLGEAISFYRRLGRHCLRLHVAEDNLRALHFYEKYGFTRIGESEGVLSRLYLMERPIS